MNRLASPFLRLRSAGLALLAITVGASSGRAQTPELILDLPTDDFFQTLNSDPLPFATSGGRVIFTAITPATGRELWITDGTPSGTRQLPEIQPGPDGSLAARPVTLPSGIVLFDATGPSGNELYAIDPVAETVELVRDIVPGSPDSNPRGKVVWNDEVYFTVNGTPGLFLLWRSDGTSAGTQPVPNPFLPGGLGDLGLQALLGPRIAATPSALYYVSASTGRALWKLSSPTGPHLQLLYDLPGLTTSSDFSYLGTRGDQVLFSFDDNFHGTELWCSDGTVAGTRLLRDLNPGPEGSFPFGIEEVGSLTWLGATVTGAGYEPFVTDGTSAGTIPLGDLNPGPQSSVFALIDERIATPNGLVFSAASGPSGFEPWISDGTPAGTVLLSDLNPGTGSSDPKGFVEFGGEYYFSATAPGVGQELFRTDGTPAGTQLAQEFAPGPASSELQILGSTPGHLTFRIDDPAVGIEPWSLPIGSSTPQVLANIQVEATPTGSRPGGWQQLQDRVVFSADHVTFGNELWITDGTPSGTQLVADLAPGHLDSAPFPLGVLGNRALFTADDSVHGRELWITDGTSAGTSLVLDAAPGPAEYGWPIASVELDGQLFFEVWDSPAKKTLWVTDGTAAGTGPFFDPAPSSSTLGVEAPLRFGDEIYFVADDGFAGAEIWKTDGTTAGTVRVTDLGSGAASLNPELFVAGGDLLYFTAEHPTLGNELYTLGLSGNAALQVDVTIGPLGTLFLSAEPLKDGIVFRTGDFLAAGRVWFTKGTPGSNVELGPLLSPGERIASLAVAGDRAYFTIRSFSTASDTEFWTSDGTLSGTRSLGSLNLLNGEIPLGPIGSTDRIVIAGIESSTDGAFTESLFVADGAGNSLEQVASFPPNGGFNAALLGPRLGDKLLLGANAEGLGSELYQISITELGGYATEPYGGGCGGARIGSTGEARLGQSFGITLEADPLAPSGLFLSAEQSFAPLGPDCQVAIGSVAYAFGATTDASGSATVQLSLPLSPSLVGVPLYWQWASLQTGGPFSGAAQLSDGLELVIGN